MSESTSFLVTIMKWRISGQGYKHLAKSSRFELSEPAASTIYKRLTLSAASIFVTEGLFIYIYFLVFEENHRNRTFRAVEEISPTISLFFRKMIALVLKFSCAKRFKD